MAHGSVTIRARSCGGLPTMAADASHSEMVRSSIALFLAGAGLMTGLTGCFGGPKEGGEGGEQDTPSMGAPAAPEKDSSSEGEGGEGGEGGED